MKTLNTQFSGTLRAADLNNIAKAVMRGNLALGKGVSSGLDVTAGTGLSVTVAPGEFSAQVADSVLSPFSVTIPANVDRYMWIEANDVPGDQPNTALEPEGSDPGSTWICLGRVTSDGSSVFVSEDGRQTFGHKVAATVDGSATAAPVGALRSVTFRDSANVANPEEFDVIAKRDENNILRLFLRYPNGTEDQFVSGLRIRAGSGAPSNTLGRNADFYMDTTGWKFYQRLDGAYSLIYTLPQATPPTFSMGAVGTTDGNASASITAVTGGYRLDLTVPRGASGIASATAPLTYDASTRTIAIPAATSGRDGYMTKTQAADLAAAKDQSTTNASAINTINGTLTSHTNSISSLSSSVSTLQSGYSNLTGLISGYGSSIATLQTNYAAHDAAILALQNANTALTARVAALESKTLKVSTGISTQTVSIALNGTTNVTIPFTTAMPDTNYTVDYAFTAVAGINLGSLSVTGVTKNTTGITLAIKSTGVLFNAALTIAVNAVRYA